MYTSQLVIWLVNWKNAFDNDIYAWNYDALRKTTSGNNTQRTYLTHYKYPQPHALTNKQN